MTIAVYIRRPDDDERFIAESFCELAKAHPADRFIVISGKAPKDGTLSLKNFITVPVKPEGRTTLQWQYFYNYRIPAVLKKFGVEVFVSTGGICTRRTTVAQCLFVNDLDFLHHPRFMKKSHVRFHKKNIPLYLAKANSVATISKFFKRSLVGHFHIDEKKVFVIPKPVPDIYKPLNHEGKEAVREKYSGGKEYFLFTGSSLFDNNRINLLKAFSLFKKRQKSNMQLLVTGKEDAGYAAFIKALQTFKYRDDVKLPGQMDPGEMALVTAAAYALVHPISWEGFSLVPLQAMRCGIPVIVSDTPAAKDLCGNAALYANPEQIGDIAEKMMLLFKDEDQRSALITAGNKRISGYMAQDIPQLMWQCITGAIQS